MTSSIIFTLIAIAIQSQTINANGYDWNIDIRSTCEQRDISTGICLNWRSAGEIERDECFLGTGLALVRRGGLIYDLPMRDLQVGDQVWSYKTATDENIFVKVLSWLHRDPKGHGWIYNITTRNGFSLKVTEDHLVWANGKYIEARDVTVGDNFQTSVGDDKETEVISIKTFLGQGMYNPLLGGDGTIYVDHLLAHTLTHTGAYGLPTDLTWKIGQQLALLTSDGSDVPDDTEYRNGFVNWLSWSFGFQGRKETVLDITYSLEKQSGSEMKTLVIHSYSTPDNESFRKLLPQMVKNHQKIRGNDNEFDRALLQTKRTVGSLSDDIKDTDDKAQVIRRSADDPVRVARRGTNNQNNDYEDSSNTEDEDDDVVRIVTFSLVAHWAHTIFNVEMVNETEFR